MCADKKIRFRNDFDVCSLNLVHDESLHEKSKDVEKKSFEANPLSPATKKKNVSM